jgi:hypothetical protein
MKKGTKAIVITTNGHARLVLIDDADGISRLIGCEMFDAISLGKFGTEKTAVDMFVDDEGILNDLPANMSATNLAMMVSGRPFSPIRGDAVIIGADESTGETIDCPNEMVSMVETMQLMFSGLHDQIESAVERRRNGGQSDGQAS